jgi:hypothetical protein
MEFNKITEFFVDDFELFSDEFLKEENVSVFIDVIKSVNVGSDGSSELPSVGRF